MNTTYIRNRLWLAARWVLPVVLAGASVAMAGDVPSQLPLLTKTGTGVPPNVILTMDDSGSMSFRHMPEDFFASDTFSTPNPVNSRTVRWDPNDGYQTGVNFAGTVPGNINSTNFVLRALRSPDTNTIFYSPEIRYQPWLMSDGVTRRANSPVATAFRDPLIQTGAAGTFVNLTSYVVPGGTGRWCYSADSTAAATTADGGCADVANNSATLNHDPGVYFRLQKTGSVYRAVDNANNYTGYSINNAGPFTKYPSRTCAAATCTSAELSQGFCAGSTCTRAEERQNYANWFSYYRNRNLLARGAMMEAFGGESNTFRLGFGRINKGLATVDGVDTRVLEDSSTYGGGAVRPFTTARKRNLIDWLDALPASGGTPLVTAMQAVGQYYSRTDDKGPWTETPGSSNTVADNKTCRRSYNIMMTDGYWNGATVSLGNIDNNVPAAPQIDGVGASYRYTAARPYLDGTSNTLADVAMYYWNRDLQPATTNAVAPYGDNISFWQNMTNFTVGLGVRGTLNPATDLPDLTSGAKNWPAASASTTAANVDDLWHAAVNSRGRYFSAKDPEELAGAIKSALASAVGGVGSTAGVATASTVLSDSNRKYVPTFSPTTWSGDISSNPLDVNGQVTSAVWSAAARMPVWSARNIVTWDSGLSTPAAVLFKWASMSVANRLALGIIATTNVVTGPPLTNKFIDFLWGDHSNEGIAGAFRTRVTGSGTPFILGDIVNSNPVLVQGSFNGQYFNPVWGGAGAYAAFLNAKAARTAVLFAGANDGMLHAFRDTKGATPASALTDGQEIFAYVPRAVYGNLDKLSSKTYGTSPGHQFYVDGPLRETDAFVKAPGASTASWRNYLLGSLGAGGRAVFALDVTDTANLGTNTVRWELTDNDLGYVLAPVRVGVLANGKWVAVFGNGYSSINDKATLFVVDLETGTAKKLDVPAGSGSNGLGGVTLMHDSAGQISNIYAGDLKGNVWKFKYDAAADSKFVVDGGAALLVATDGSGVPQSFTSSPALFSHSQGGVIVVIGTGKLFTGVDANDSSAQTIYGIWDKPADSIVRPLARSSLAGRTLTAFQGSATAAGTTFYGLTGIAVDYATQRGWYLDISTALPGGRIIYPTQVYGAKQALVSSVAPVQGTPGPCDSGSGIGVNLVLPVETGLSPVGGGSGGAGAATGRMFDTDGSGSVNSSDAIAIGYKTAADGIDALVRSQTTSLIDALADKGGGATESDCTGTTCSSGSGSGGGGGDDCVVSTFCGAGKCLVSIQGATQGFNSCRDKDPVVAGVVGVRQYDRVWRRIINPPIQ